MTETAEAAPTRNQPTSPLKLYGTIFCKRCPDHEYCNTNKTHMQNCILTLIADELARTRQLLQQRTQHLSW